MKQNTKTKRVYRKITPRTVANHAAAAVVHGSGAAAVRAIEPEYSNEYNRATRIARKEQNQDAAAYIEASLQQIAEPAVQRVSELVMSRDERIATKNAHYVLDQIRGKAVQRSISLTGRLNIQNVLD